MDMMYKKCEKCGKSYFNTETHICSGKYNSLLPGMESYKPYEPPKINYIQPKSVETNYIKPEFPEPRLRPIFRPIGMDPAKWCLKKTPPGYIKF